MEQNRNQSSSGNENDVDPDTPYDPIREWPFLPGKSLEDSEAEFADAESSMDEMISNRSDEERDELFKYVKNAYEDMEAFRKKEGQLRFTDDEKADICYEVRNIRSTYQKAPTRRIARGLMPYIVLMHLNTYRLHDAIGDLDLEFFENLAAAIKTVKGLEETKSIGTREIPLLALKAYESLRKKGNGTPTKGDVKEATIAAYKKQRGVDFFPTVRWTRIWDAAQISPINRKPGRQPK